MTNYSDKIVDAKCYKKTVTKIYKVYVCKPKEGTEFTGEGMHGIMVTTKEKPFILMEPSGKVRGASLEEIINEYKFIYGKTMTIEALRSRFNKDGTLSWLHLQRNEFGKEVFVINIPSSVRFATTVYGRQLVVNSVYGKHGSGDYIVCDSVLDKPDFSTIRVVNGLDFAHMYSTRSIDCGSCKYRIKPAKPTWDYVNSTPLGNDKKVVPYISSSSKNDVVIDAIKKYFRPKVSDDNVFEINYGEMRYTMDLVKVNGERQLRVKKANRRYNTTNGTSFLAINDKLITNIEKMIKRDSR